MADIMIVEDEASIRQILSMHLHLVGHQVRQAQDAAQARGMFEEKVPDLVLMDIMLPGEDGFSLGEYFIAQDVPVLFLTAKTSVADRVRGISMGAQDYILKPFEPMELLARVENILRRTRKEETALACGDLFIDFSARRVMLSGEEIVLTAMEFDLLAMLARRRNVAMSREELLGGVSLLLFP